ncbi:MAG: EAL domain-containing protein [Eubacteriales bacterium]|nr:EAL domain-containing protein [Eubacteriales bacterium]
MNTGKRLSAAFVVFVGVALLFLLWIFHGGTAGSPLPMRNTANLESIETMEDGIRIHTMEIPDDFSEAGAVLFKTTHTMTEVRLDGMLIYQYGREENAPKFMKSPGSPWHLVDIPEKSAGKTLEVRIYPVYEGFYGNTGVFHLGTRAACVMELFVSFLPVLIINCIIVFAGVLSIFLHIATSRHRGKEEIGTFLNVGVFSLMIAVWSLCQCGFLQFLIPDGRTLYFVDFFSFYLFPVPFNLFVYDITRTKYRKGLLWMAGGYLANMAGALAVQCAGLIDIFRVLPVTHLLMAVNVLYVILLVRNEAQKNSNKDAGRFRFPLYIVMIFAAAELVMYYIRGFRETSVFLPLGTICFIVMLIWIQVIRYYGKVIEEEKLSYFKKLANIDMLTEALNRNAYENTVKYLEEKEIELQTTGVILVDVNEMKYINDNFGHEKGDEALKYCYQCICRCFGAEDRCFRIGGDEFAYVFHKNEKPDIEREIAAFEKLVDETGKNLPYPFSVAVGYACYNPDTDMDFQDIVRRSDTMMYRKKRRKKLMKADGTEEILDYIKKDLMKASQEELLLHQKKYQEISIEDLCEFINLLNPSTDDYLYVLDFRKDFYYIAPHALQRFLLDENAFHEVMEHHKRFVYAEDFGLLKEEFESLLSSDRCMHNMEYRWLDIDGKPVWINCRGCIVRDDDGKAMYMVGCINEIGIKQKADNVSGLLGESSLQAYLESMEPQFPDGYLMRLGIDNFKEINEKFGIEYGDMILHETAICISRCISQNQKIYKLVADEFMVLDFTGSSRADAEAMFDRIREALAQFVEDNGYAVIFTISGGILTCDSMVEHTYSNAMKFTEFSLNGAKSHGKNRCHLFRKEEYEAFLHRRELSRILRKSINQGFEGFQVYYQPLFRASDNSLYGAEALMRFDSEECGRVSPGEFIPILEETGLIIPAGRWILREALAACRKIRETVPDFEISVNVSHVQVSKTNMLLEIVSAVRDAGVPTSALIVELTESGLLEASRNAKMLWMDLHDLGIKLALDDFGTGYSNFHYLSELKPDIIKIDRSFVTKALENEEEYYLLFLLSSMTHNLKLKLCIEGVESEAEWARIRELLPDYSQGYFWGKPCSYETFTEQFVKPCEI